MAEQKTVYKKLLDARAGLELCLKCLEKDGYRWQLIKPINEGRYYIIEGLNQYNISIVFKREWFLKYGEMGFISQEGMAETGLGETLNVDDLKSMLVEEVKVIYTVTEEGKIYYISMEDFLFHSHKWLTKEGKDVRSISIHRLHRYNG